jgi:hypothetical protein
MAGNESSETAHLAQHGAALYGVGPDGGALDGGSGGLEACDADGQRHEY